ncbi:unnamed protein product [marine sediment metagenome]|uniref:Uncharacterized protein n=1 Tax=marine sediment metagenome TaxID=412755 RepID=X1PK68_9ZZZZ
MKKRRTLWYQDQIIEPVVSDLFPAKLNIMSDEDRERIKREIQNAEDIHDAERALAEAEKKGTTPFNEVMKEFGLEEKK